MEYFWVLALSVTLGLICRDVLGVLFRNGFASEVGIEWRESIRLESGSLAQLPLLRDFEQESRFCFYSVEVQGAAFSKLLLVKEKVLLVDRDILQLLDLSFDSLNCVRGKHV